MSTEKYKMLKSEVSEIRKQMRDLCWYPGPSKEDEIKLDALGEKSKTLLVELYDEKIKSCPCDDKAEVLTDIDRKFREIEDQIYEINDSGGQLSEENKKRRDDLIAKGKELYAITYPFSQEEIEFEKIHEALPRLYVPQHATSGDAIYRWDIMMSSLFFDEICALEDAILREKDSVKQAEMIKKAHRLNAIMEEEIELLKEIDLTSIGIKYLRPYDPVRQAKVRAAMIHLDID